MELLKLYLLPTELSLLEILEGSLNIDDLFLIFIPTGCFGPIIGDAFGLDRGLYFEESMTDVMLINLNDSSYY